MTALDVPEAGGNAGRARGATPCPKDGPRGKGRADDCGPTGDCGGGARAWLATTVATVLSTYALDAFATAVGVALVASALLATIEPPLPLVFLAATYVTWGVALRVNLAANWALLTATGASTNLLSKAAHDLARARHAGARLRRMAASTGYVATEVAKEAPYYAGATGAALASDAVAATDAVIFLGGANIGASVYEYGLARATRRFLKGR